MLVTRRQLIVVLAVTLSYWVGQLLTGTDATVASLFTSAIFFGMLAIFAGGGLRSAFGCLNALLIGKFLLFAVAVKILFFEPADRPLNAPHTTAVVMALGFLGLFLGTAMQSQLRSPQSWLANRLDSPRMLLSLSIVLFATSYLGFFASMIASAQGDGLSGGGWLGIVRTFGSLKSLSIVPPMLYLWKVRSHRWMTHPVVIGLLIWSVVLGIFSTGKQDAMEPLVFYVLVGFLRYGWSDRRLWSVVAVGAVYYAIIVFPYSQYIRAAGGREGPLGQRAAVIEDAFWRISSNDDFRSTVTDRVSKVSYFTVERLAPFNRLAMVAEADRLISATERQQAFTGWETIVWGFKLITPSFLYPSKPNFEAGNYLGHIVGEISASNTGTQVSYGVMANLYNAFSFTGVLVGTLLFFAAFYYWIRIFLGDVSWDGAPTTSTLWFIWVIASCQHSIVESSLSGIMAGMWLPFGIVLFCVLAEWFAAFLPSELAPA